MPLKPKYVAGLVQMSCSPSPDENLQKAAALVEDAAHRGAEIVCLPELFQSLYFCQREDVALFDLAETVPGPTTETLGKVAKARGVVIIAPLFERRAPGVYHNSAAIIDASGEVVGLYRKMHIPDDPAYYEKFYFTPGDLGFRAFNTQVGRIATLICWDQWYPEGARLAALQGPSILFYPTAIGWHPAEKEQYGPSQHDAWRTLQRGHAIANGVYVAAVNRMGLERTSSPILRLTRPGESTASLRAQRRFGGTAAVHPLGPLAERRNVRLHRYQRRAGHILVPLGESKLQPDRRHHSPRRADSGDLRRWRGPGQPGSG